jgi:integrase/recombinase XerC
MELTRENCDFDSLTICVRGKGNKDRQVPISTECRKILYKFLQRHNSHLVFSTIHGGKLSYDNMRRDFNKLMATLGIETDGAFHSLRRTFATNFAREGGNLVSDCLGLAKRTV